MEERNYGAAGVLGNLAAQDRAPLDRLLEHANSAERIGDMIEQFLGRFNHGAMCADCDSAEGLRAVDTSHAAKLERLEKNLARAEELARQLSAIG